MNHKLLALSISGLTLSTLGVIYQPPALAQRTSFYCDTGKSPATTYIKSRGRKSAVIRWNLAVGKNSAKQRCRIVSQRFQRLYDSGNLRFFKTGVLNGQNVVCAARTSGDPCNNRSLLFTLTRGSNPNTVLAQLFNAGSLATSSVVNQSASGSPTSNGNSTDPLRANNSSEQAYNFEIYLQDLPNEEKPSDEPTL
jgi:hypothetical protein